MTDESRAAKRADRGSDEPPKASADESTASEPILPEEMGMRPRPSQAEGPERPGTQTSPRPPRPSQAEGERRG
jgi:hypothetical protein